MTDIPTDRLVKAYIKMRDAKAELKRRFEEEEKKIEEQMDTVERHLLEVCKAAGADSIKTAEGTIIRKVQSRYWTSDWESMHKFVISNNAPELLERRISQTTMKEFLQNNPDKLPPGLNADSQYKITIRRSS